VSRDYINISMALVMASELGIDLPGEATGIVIPEKQVKPVDLATISMVRLTV